MIAENCASKTLRSGFIESWQNFPERPALDVDGKTYCYRELGVLSAALAHQIPENDGGPPLVAVFGHRAHSSFAGILAALLRGKGYVPLNPAFPLERTRKMLARSFVRTVVIGEDGLSHAKELLRGLDPLTVILPDIIELSPYEASLPQHRFVGKEQLLPVESWTLPPVDPNSIAYLLFTSGSTGEPKGVMVAHRNACHFLDVMTKRYDINEHDRFSQTFDLTFDLSVFDIFMAWEKGACLYCPSTAEKRLPAKYIQRAGLTVWFSVPSTAVLMSRLRMLKPDAYPTLRWSLFCGEALPEEVAVNWLKAAPQSIVENLYGPTELTIACTLYRWNPETSPGECENAVVPIGAPYPGMDVRIVDEHQQPVAPGEVGELLMTGPQLALGYWQDEERTAKAFVVPPGESRTFYRTGDLVRRPRQQEPLIYLGRVDHQVKIQGYRVELGEIEAVAKKIAGIEVAVAVGWPVTASGAEGIVLFLGADALDTDALQQILKERFPVYMQPRAIHLVQDWPLNANGKIDRKALTKNFLAG